MGWFGERVSKVICDGKSSLFWHDNWLGDVHLHRRFDRLFNLATYKLISLAEMCALGWRWRERRGGGGEVCGCGKRRC